jgi:hypothetical protein
MTTATLCLSTSLASATAAPKRPSLPLRLYDAFMEARMQAAMRELARHRHVRLQEKIKPVDALPQDEVKRAGYAATYADAGLLPFVR